MANIQMIKQKEEHIKKHRNYLMFKNNKCDLFQVPKD